MIYCLLVIVFFATIASGPAGLDIIEQYRTHRERCALDDVPVARVVYLPSAACRQAPTWPETLDAID